MFGRIELEIRRDGYLHRGENIYLLLSVGGYIGKCDLAAGLVGGPGDFSEFSVLYVFISPYRTSVLATRQRRALVVNTLSVYGIKLHVVTYTANLRAASR